MAQSWSLQLAEQFHLNLPKDVVAWFDSEIWKETAPVGFGEPASPGDISNVWGGQMLPDTLPILGNGFGDCLCLRIQTDGSVAEIVRWLHEGAFWTPYGNSLCEALLLDAALALREELSSPELGDQADWLVFADWALEQLQGQAATDEIIDQGLSLENLLASGLAETAVRRELCKQCWTSGLLRSAKHVGGQSLAEKLGIDWPEFSTWLVDADLVPDRYKKKLARLTGRPIEELLLQDWEGANREARRVSQLRTDMLWPYAVMGWTAERQGRLDLAVDHYYAGLKTPETSADFTAHWRLTSVHGARKFPLARLSALQEELPPSILEDNYLQSALGSENARECFDAIRDYWIEEGEQAEAKGLHDRAYRCYYSAGWDLHCADDMREILASLVRTARAAGWPALCRLAEVHFEHVSEL